MRFFHRFGSINYSYLGLINGILLDRKRKTKYTKALEYIEKYAYVLNNVEIQEVSDKFPNKIWQLWLQGEDSMPLIVKKCHASVKKYYPENVVLLTKTNIADYIKLPDFIEEKYRKGIISHANYSDIVRLSLLARYGGCWIDSTIYLTDKIPDEILNADLFTFRSTVSENLKFIKDIKQFKIYSNHINKTIDIESPYFIRAEAGNILINAVLALFLEYWKYENSLFDYLMIDKFFNLAVLKNNRCKEEFLNMPVYYLENVLLLQNALFEKYDDELFKSIKEITSVHKLTHKNLHRNPYKDSFLSKILDGSLQLIN